ncbi:unnamed protein product [Rotaria sordida]|uniref:Uncharacterized protein n=1 Tax=Rotaria sordida TaxID=392033 RepID=A0A819B3A9_9BILA|nr:unnamed protein product [Rotaria sordida]CAF1081121.1 unnamed protein product [Rotaria sordida]CAF3790010.1 unnamed protein product [Rotaria sordida]CAF3801055.1 unnamed protein product [Rotaria sordida]
MADEKDIAGSRRGQPNSNKKKQGMPHTLTLGAKHAHGESPFTGLMADLSIWGRWLTPLEIRTIYAQKRPIDQIQVGSYVKDSQLRRFR